MAKTNEKVLNAVEARLKENPGASVDELYDLAKGISREISKLSKRQFHARYPLQIKRKNAPPKPRRRKRSPGRAKATSNGQGREAVRKAFLDFAAELAAAEERKDAVRVVAGIDQYVDRVLKATGSA